MKESMCSRWHLRLIVLLILFFPLTLSAAQGRVTVKGQSITLRQAIKIIESSSNFKFFFNPSDLDALPSKNLDCEGEISDVLKEVFAGSAHDCSHACQLRNPMPHHLHHRMLHLLAQQDGLP